MVTKELPANFKRNNWIAPLYDLVGEGKLEGEFQEGDIFLITSDVDAAIRNLDDSFRAWKVSGEKRAGKKG